MQLGDKWIVALAASVVACSSGGAGGGALPDGGTAAAGGFSGAGTGGGGLFGGSGGSGATATGGVAGAGAEGGSPSGGSGGEGGCGSLTTCPQGCADLEADPDNCGSCGYACSTNIAGAKVVCQGGKCGEVCSDPKATLCGSYSACFDLTSDPDNCGSCGNQCTAPAGGSVACVAGKCQDGCPSGYTQCGAKCIDTSTDNANCGQCGSVCTSSASSVACQAGKCQCTGADAGKTLCNGVCVDTQNDWKNCGSCGKDCTTAGGALPYGASVACEAGTCVAHGSVNPTCYYQSSCQGKTCADFCQSGGYTTVEPNTKGCNGGFGTPVGCCGYYKYSALASDCKVAVSCTAAVPSSTTCSGYSATIDYVTCPCKKTF